MNLIRRFTSPLLRISPLDGRYSHLISPLPDFLSESGLIKYRAKVEVAWFIHLASSGILLDKAGIPIKLSESDIRDLNNLWSKFQLKDAEWVKNKELETNHDLKAVEYYLKEHSNLKEYTEYFHVCCTSEDINNLSYSLMFQDSLRLAMIPALTELINKIKKLAFENSAVAMLSRTHGQPATPTTVGKELANFVYRINRHLKALNELQLTGKCNGAVGNYNAHQVTFTGVDWLKSTEEFVSKLGLKWNPYTTQIEPHDLVAEMCGKLSQVNTILLDLSRDMWGYISLGYFKGVVKEKEVGSSTMPHKVNPIDFENAEGNLGIANSILIHLEHKLPISRFQRDLSDSTALRNVGVGLGHSLVAYKSLMKGFEKISVNREQISHDLNSHWEVLAEPVQMILRKYGFPQPYELLKKHTRGLNSMNSDQYLALVDEIEKELKLPSFLTLELKKLTPDSYTGLAQRLAELLPTLLNK